MKQAVVHVVGAGAAGLAAADALLSSGRFDVVVHEAKPYPGGRRRSFHDDKLGLDVDTGNFPILSGWTSTVQLIEAAGARDQWRAESEPGLDFADFSTGARWRLRPSAGWRPWWIFSPSRRGPDLRLADFLKARGLLSARADATVASVAAKSSAFERVWRPLTVAALNCAPEIASARLAGGALRLTGLGRETRLLTPAVSFGRAFVEPLTRRLVRNGAKLRLERRLIGLDFDHQRVTGLDFEFDHVDLGARDLVILAVSWGEAAGLVPGLEPPSGAASVITVHFAATAPAQAPAIMGAVNGPFHWLFCYRDRISVTILDAGPRIDAPRERTAAECWAGVAGLTGLSDDLPAWRVIGNRRASFLATPHESVRRPTCETTWRNLCLAGGYVAGLTPDCLEGAIHAGQEAAKILQTLAKGSLPTIKRA